MAEPQFLNGPYGRLAFRRIDGTGPTLLWFGGLRSDMDGSKANFVAEWARARGRAFTRFDYSGHGLSEGEFADGTISAWTADARAVVDACVGAPFIAVGSSMGAWIASLIARERPERIAGALFIAPAPDFTSALVEPSLSDADRAALADRGYFEAPSDYDEPQIFTRALLEDGRAQSVFNAPLTLDAPVRILQGDRDDAVPASHAIRFFDHLQARDLTLTLIKDGDHRLSKPRDLERLALALDELSAAASARV